MKRQEQPELSYYGLYLLRYLLEQHSRKAKDLSFIYSREQLAAETFEQARLDGYPVEGAHELASLTFAEKLLPLLAPVFEPYDLAEPEFELTPDYMQLYTELTGAVVLYIEQYGVQ